MQLSIEIAGYKNEVAISAVPRAFLARVARHCHGKNNTPYFAHNCFKGVLYFDEELARKFARQVGYDWSGWWEECRFHHRAAYVFEAGMRIQVRLGGQEQTIYPSQVTHAETPVSQQQLLHRLDPSEVLVFMGSIDKGAQTFLLDGFEGEFDPAQLAVFMESFAEFGHEDKLITGLAYAGRPMTPGHDDSKGKRMIVPALFAPDGAEVELDDLLGEGESC